MNDSYERPLYYDMQGKPMTTEQWVAAFENIESRKIGNYNGRFVHVSTVWLGLDHSFGFGGPPVIFESMAFPKHHLFGGRCGELDQVRYCTLAQAKAGHLDMVEKWGGLRGFWRLFWMTVWRRATAE